MNNWTDEQLADILKKLHDHFNVTYFSGRCGVGAYDNRGRCIVYFNNYDEFLKWYEEHIEDIKNEC